MRASPVSLAIAAADFLTATRLLIALALVPVSWREDLTVTAILVSLAWLTDVLDGRLARAAGTEGRLGRWDMTADTAVGAALLIGLTGSGTLPVWFAAAALLVFGGLHLAGNLAASMLLQLAGYLPLIGMLFIHKPTGWWLPMATALIIGALDWRRLLTVNIPNFIGGIAGRFEGR